MADPQQQQDPDRVALFQKMLNGGASDDDITFMMGQYDKAKAAQVAAKPDSDSVLGGAWSELKGQGHDIWNMMQGGAPNPAESFGGAIGSMVGEKVKAMIPKAKQAVQGFMADPVHAVEGAALAGFDPAAMMTSTMTPQDAETLKQLDPTGLASVAGRKEGPYAKAGRAGVDLAELAAPWAIGKLAEANKLARAAKLAEAAKIAEAGTPGEAAAIKANPNPVESKMGFNPSESMGYGYEPVVPGPDYVEPPTPEPKALPPVGGTNATFEMGPSSLVTGADADRTAPGFAPQMLPTEAEWRAEANAQAKAEAAAEAAAAGRTAPPGTEPAYPPGGVERRGPNRVNTPTEDKAYELVRKQIEQKNALARAKQTLLKKSAPVPEPPVEPGPTPQEAAQAEAAAAGDNVSHWAAPDMEEQVNKGVEVEGVSDPATKFLQEYARTPDHLKDALVESQPMETLKAVRQVVGSAPNADPGLMRRLAFDVAEKPPVVAEEGPELAGAVPPTGAVSADDMDLARRVHDNPQSTPPITPEPEPEVAPEDDPTRPENIPADLVAREQAVVPPDIRQQMADFARGMNPPAMGGGPVEPPTPPRPTPSQAPKKGSLEAMVQQYGRAGAADRAGMSPKELDLRLRFGNDVSGMHQAALDEIGATKTNRMFGTNYPTTGKIPLDAVRDILKKAAQERAETGSVSPKTQAYLDKIKDQRGFATLGPALAVGGATAGGMVGSMLPSEDDDSRGNHVLMGALTGGVLGASAANPLKALDTGVKLMTEGRLSGTAPLKHLAMTAGAPFMAAIENTPSKGRLALFKEYLNLPENAKAFWRGNADNSMANTVAGARQGNNNVINSRFAPSHIIGGMAEATRDAMRRSGMNTDAINRATLMNPENNMRKAYGGLNQYGNQAMRIFDPFTVIPANIQAEGLNNYGELGAGALGQKVNPGKVALSAGSTAAGYELGKFAKKSKRNALLARIAAAAFGPYTLQAAAASALSAGPQHAVESLSPVPEISLSNRKSLLGWPPSIVTAVENLNNK